MGRSDIRKKGGLAGALMALAVLVGSPASAQQSGATGQQAGGGTERVATPTAEHEIPPIDLFVYADQSQSVFKGEPGARPADKLIGMIQTALNSPIDIGSRRKVLDQDGRFTLYGFGEDNPVREAAHSCDDDITAIVENVRAGNRGAIDRALASYGSASSGRKATNFACLLDHIRSNPDIQRSTDANRQAMILIASDFLHDPFNTSEIGASEDHLRLLNNGIFEAKSGICELRDRYQNSDLPQNIQEPLLTLRRMVREDARFPPVFAFLEQRLTEADLSGSNSRYRGCAIETTAEKLLPELMQQPLEAEQFDFDGLDENSFARQFARLLLARAAPRLTLSTAEVTVIGAGRAELSATLNNEGRLPVNAIRVQTRQGDGRWTNAANVEERVNADGKTAFGPVRLDISGFQPEAPVQVRVLYRFEDLSAVLTSVPYTAESRTTKPLIISITDPAPIGPTSFISQVTISSQLAEPVRITGAALGTSRGTAVGVDVSAVDRQELSQGSPPVVLPLELSQAQLDTANLTLFVTATLQGASGEPLQEEQAIPSARARPIEVDTFNLRYDSYENPSPQITVSLSNPNAYALNVGACLVSFGDQEMHLTPGEAAVLLANAEGQSFRPVAPDLATDLLRAMSEGQTPSLRCQGEGVAGPGEAKAMTLTAPDGQPGFRCASPENADLYDWVVDGANGTTLTLRFETNAAFSGLAPKIGAYEIIGLSGREENLEVIKGNGGRLHEIKIPFHSEERRNLKFSTRSGVGFRFYTTDKDLLCNGPISVPAHAAREPVDFQIVEGSWRSQGRQGEDLFLEFEIFHQSQFSLNRLDRIEIVDPAVPGRGEEVIFDFVTPSGTEAAPGAERYVAPGTGNKRTVRIDLTGSGLSNRYLQDQALMLLSDAHHIQRRPEPIRIGLRSAPVSIRTADWRTDKAQLAITLTSKYLASVDRVVLSRTVEMQSAANYQVIRLPRQVGLANDDSLDILVDLPRDLLVEAETILLSQPLFLCALRPRDKLDTCTRPFQLPDLPRAESELQAGGGEYVPETATLSFENKNLSPYPNRVSAIVARNRAGVERRIDLPPDDGLFMPAKATTRGEVPISDPAMQRFLHEALVAEIQVDTLRPQDPTSLEIKFAPPFARIVNGDFDHVDLIAARVERWVAAQLTFDEAVSSRVDVVDQPFFSAEVLVERPRGGLQDLTLRAQVLGRDDQPIGEMSDEVPMFGTKSDTDVVGATGERRVPLAITASEALFESGTKVRLEIRQEGNDTPIFVSENAFPIDGTVDYDLWNLVLYVSIGSSIAISLIFLISRKRQIRFLEWSMYPAYRKYFLATLALLVLFVIASALQIIANSTISAFLTVLQWISSPAPILFSAFGLTQSVSLRPLADKGKIDMTTVLMQRQKGLLLAFAILAAVLLIATFVIDPIFSTKGACEQDPSGLRITQEGACR